MRDPLNTKCKSARLAHSYMFSCKVFQVRRPRLDKPVKNSQNYMQTSLFSVNVYFSTYLQYEFLSNFVCFL